MRHLEPDGEQSFRVTVAMLTVAVVVVALRMAAKAKARSRLKASDWLILVTLASFVSMMGSYLNGLFEAGGRLDVVNMTPAQIDIIYKWVYVAEMLFTLTIALLKFSIIVFYHDLFGTCAPFRRAMLAIGLLHAAWFLTCFLVNAFQCAPARAALAPVRFAAEGGRARCINYSRFIVGYETTNMALDVAILAACVWMVRRLQLSAAQRWFVSGIIGLGGFVCVVCILRIYYFTAFSFTFGLNAKVNLNLLLSWSGGQLTMGILCACIPCYGPLLPTQKVVRRLDRWYSSRQHSNGGSGSNSNSHSRGGTVAQKGGSGGGGGGGGGGKNSYSQAVVSYATPCRQQQQNRFADAAACGRQGSSSSGDSDASYGYDKRTEKDALMDRDVAEGQSWIRLDRSYAVSSERNSGAFV